MVRSIPARAGEPLSAERGYFFLPVYPRACGGTQQNIVNEGAVGGLSPRVRGNRPLGDDTLCVDRSIPARAGEPEQSGAVWSASGVYPRACGGTLDPAVRRLVLMGLSPRVRGNHQGLGRR